MNDDRWFPAEWLDGQRLRTLVAPTLARVEAAMARDRLPHALLLAGPEGLGRELLAVEIAAKLIVGPSCVSEANESAIRRVRAGNHPDVVLIHGEGRKGVIRIASIRRVVDEAPGRPFEGAHRVWILNGADAGRFPAEAANAFLKVLEEPPKHVRFLLLAANPQSVLTTIRSRCSCLSLPGIVAASASTHNDTGVPPELTQNEDDGTPIAELVQMATRELPAVMVGDHRAAISLATVMGEQSGGLEIMAAAALELATSRDAGESGERYAGLAAELLESERITKTLALRPERQLLASLLRWGCGVDVV